MDLMNLLYKDNTMLQVMLEQVKAILMTVIVTAYYSFLLIQEINIMGEITGYGKFFFKRIRLFCKEPRLMMRRGLHGNRLINFKQIYIPSNFATSQLNLQARSKLRLLNKNVHYYYMKMPFKQLYRNRQQLPAFVHMIDLNLEN